MYFCQSAVPKSNISGGSNKRYNLTPSGKSYNATTFSKTTLRIFTLTIKGLFVTLSINGTQHYNTLYWVQLCRVLRFIYCYTECRYAECHFAECHFADCHFVDHRYAECCYAECHYLECYYAESVSVIMLNVFILNVIILSVMLNAVTLSVIMLNVVMLSVVKMSVVLLSVVAPKLQP